MDQSQSEENTRPTGVALLPLSPDRLNQQKAVISPGSPSKQSRNVGEVDAKVAFLNNLSRIQSPTTTVISGSDSFNSSAHSSQHSTHSAAALQRAVLGREEAETALRRTQDALSEARERERKVSEKLQALIADTQILKEKQARQRDHDRGIAEREIKKARKEAFHNGSAIVNLQEQLRLAYSDAENLRKELKKERQAKEEAVKKAVEHERSLQQAGREAEKLRSMIQSLEHDSRADELEKKCKAAEEEIVSLQTHMVELGQTAQFLERQISQSKTQITSMEEELKIERDAHERTVAEHLEANHVVEKLMKEIDDLRDQLHSKTIELSARTEELAHGRQKLFRRSQASTPQLGRKRSSLTPRLSDQARLSPGFLDSPASEYTLLSDSDVDPLKELKRHIKWEKTLRQRAEERVEYMKMECQFHQCSCRIAERSGSRYVHDVAYDRKYRSDILNIDKMSARAVDPNGDGVAVEAHIQQPKIKQEGADGNDSGLEITVPIDYTSISPEGKYHPGSPRGKLHENPASGGHVTPEHDAVLEFLPGSGTFRRINKEARPFRDEPVSVMGLRCDRAYGQQHATSPELGTERPSTPNYSTLQHLSEGGRDTRGKVSPSGRNALTSMSQYTDVQMDDFVASVPSTDIGYLLPKEGVFKAKRYHPAPPPRRYRIEKEKQFSATREEHRERQYLAQIVRELSDEPVDHSQTAHGASITSSRSHPIFGSSHHQHTIDKNLSPVSFQHQSQPATVLGTPISINREEALAQIRARRERAAQQRSKSVIRNSRPNTAAGIRSSPTAGKRRTRDDEPGGDQPGNGRLKRHISEKA
ncbi:hypothetical protein KEM54_002462 [Ascosphaera aggregata]|nr:hypothetical protein KEM54_002462 [Ascosphaera aggregata]